VFSVAAAFFLAASAVAFGRAGSAERVVVGYIPVTGDAKFFVAKERGFFADEGLDVELLEFQNSADGLAAIRAGKLDTGAFGTVAPLIHISKGADLRIIGGIMGEDTSIITTPEKAGAIRSAADLKGSKIATIRLSTSDAVLRGALHNAGLSWKNDVEIAELKNPPAVLEAVKSGEVDLGVVWGPFDLQAAKQGLVAVLNSRQLLPGHPCCRLSVTGENFEGRKDVWTRFLRAILKAERYAKADESHRDDTVDIILKYSKLDRDIIKNGYYHGILDQTSDPNFRGLLDFWDILLAAEYIVFSNENPDPARFVETAPYLDALASLRREEPGDAFWKETEELVSERNKGQAGGGRAR
jgi:NitT/TauT family transport system substrate-binding protein